MKPVQRLPKHHQWHTMPTLMITYCGYAQGKMSVNGGSMIFGLASLVICVAIGRGHSWMQYCLALEAKERATGSLPHSEMEQQQRINELWFCKSGNSKAIRSLWDIIRVFGAVIGKRDSDTLAAPSSKSAQQSVNDFWPVIQGNHGAIRSSLSIYDD